MNHLAGLNHHTYARPMSEASPVTQITKLALIGFRCDENSSFMKGSADAPPQIRAAFRSDASNLFSESGIDLGADGLFFDAGDMEPVSGSEPMTLIQDSIFTLLNDGLAPLSLGGDHSTTYQIVKAFARKFPELSILHCDAHPDIYDSFQGNRLSHASPFARIMEEGLVKRLVQVGVRTSTAHQREQTKKFGVEVVEMKNFRDGLQIKF